MNEKQLRALTNTIQLYNTGQLDLNDDQLRDLKQIADAAGIAFSPETSGSRAALGFVNNLAFGIPGAVAGAFGSEMFDPITSTEEAAGSVGSLLSFLVGGGIAGKAIGGAAVRGLSGKKARDLAVRGAAALRSTGLPGGRALYGGQQRVSSAIANSPALQEAIRSGAGFGAVGGLEGLMSEDGSLLGGAMSGATLGALGSLGLGALRGGKGAATAASSRASTSEGEYAARRALAEIKKQRAMDPGSSSAAAGSRSTAASSASASGGGRAGRATEELRAQEAMEQAVAEQAAAASAIMGLRGSSRAVRGANFTPNSKGLFARLEEAFDTGANSLNSLFGGTPREQFMREMRLRDIGSAKLRQSYLRQGMPGYSNRPYPLQRSLYSE